MHRYNLRQRKRRVSTATPSTKQRRIDTYFQSEEPVEVAAPAPAPVANVRRSSGAVRGHSSNRRVGGVYVLRMPLYASQKRARARRLAKRTVRRRTGGIFGVGRFHGQPVRLRGQGAYNWRGALARAGQAIQTVGRRVVPAGTFSRMGAGAGAALGQRIAGGLGARVGSALGGLAGSQVAKIAGFGSYNVKRNSILKLPEGSAVPAFGSLDQCTVVSHREFVDNIYVPASPLAFTVESYRLNPGNQKLFPWLHIIASAYDQYQFLGMVFHFKSSSGDVSTTSALGSVIMATDYQVKDPPYASKTEMSNSQYAMSGKPTRDLMHPIECDPGLHPTPLLNIRIATTDNSAEDARWYDHGVFQIATDGLAGTAGNVLGELWVTYQVALYKPTMAAGIVGRRGILSDSFDLSTSISTSAYLQPTASGSKLGNTGSSLGGSILTHTYTFPSHITQGVYMFMYTVRGASTALTNAIDLTYVNATQHDPAGTGFGRQAAGTTAVIQFIWIMVRVTGRNASVTIAGGTLPGTITSGELQVLQMDSDIAT